MAYVIDERKMDRLISALSALGEHGLVNRGTIQEREFILAFKDVQDELSPRRLSRMPASEKSLLGGG
jgi:hypothetical protein